MPARSAQLVRQLHGQFMIRSAHQIIDRNGNPFGYVDLKQNKQGSFFC